VNPLRLESLVSFFPRVSVGAASLRKASVALYSLGGTTIEVVSYEACRYARGLPEVMYCLANVRLLVVGIGAEQETNLHHDCRLTKPLYYLIKLCFIRGIGVSFGARRVHCTYFIT